METIEEQKSSQEKTENNNSNPVDLSKLFEEEKKQGTKANQASSASPPPMAPWQSEAAPAIHPNTPRIVRCVIMYSGGLIRTERQASYVLMALVVLALMSSFSLLFSSGSAKPPDPSSPEYKAYMRVLKGQGK